MLTFGATGLPAANVSELSLACWPSENGCEDRRLALYYNMSFNTVIAGVGSGMGAALARKFCGEGGRVALLARSRGYLNRLARELSHEGHEALPVPVDLARPGQVSRAFKELRRKWGRTDMLIYNASETAWKGLLMLTPREFEHAWRACVFGAFLCSRAAAQDMVPLRAGVLLFTGATSSMRGRKGAADFSSAKFSLRGLAESLARELWPNGSMPGPERTNHVWVNDTNAALLVDHCELTTLQDCWREWINEEPVFSLFAPSLPARRNCPRACGLDDALPYLENLRSQPTALEFLHTLHTRSEFASEFCAGCSIFVSPATYPLWRRTRRCLRTNPCSKWSRCCPRRSSSRRFC